MPKTTHQLQDRPSLHPSLPGTPSLQPSLLGTPRLVVQGFSLGSPWVSQPPRKKGALAPGVRFLIHATVLFGLMVPATVVQAQLPAGTTDASQPQTQKQDPLLTHANQALDKHDYPTALKLLTTLTETTPNAPH